MHPYLSILQLSGLPPLAIALATGEHQLGVERPFRGGGFPPAFLPLTETDSGVRNGYWKHWFVPQRKPTLVEFYGVTRFGRYLMALERARSIEQYIIMRLVEEISLDGGLSRNSRRLASSLKVDELSEILSLAESEGDDLKLLAKFPLFATDPPQACFDDLDGYSGDFPRPGMERDPSLLHTACSYEIHSRFTRGRPTPDGYRAKLIGVESAPDWLRATEQPAIFHAHLSRGNRAAAWLSLNSIGWKFAEARTAILALADQAKDKIFSAVADAWCDLPHEQFMGEAY